MLDSLTFRGTSSKIEVFTIFSEQYRDLSSTNGYSVPQFLCTIISTYHWGDSETSWYELKMRGSEWEMHISVLKAAIFNSFFRVLCAYFHHNIKNNGQYHTQSRSESKAICVKKFMHLHCRESALAGWNEHWNTGDASSLSFPSAENELPLQWYFWHYNS